MQNTIQDILGIFNNTNKNQIMQKLLPHCKYHFIDMKNVSQIIYTVIMLCGV